MRWDGRQHVLLINVSEEKSFEEKAFSCEFFVCLSCNIIFGQYFPINIFKSGGRGGVGKSVKWGLII